MVGFLGAIAGGAMKGWGAGTMQEIKDKREEKLKLLDQQFQSSESALTRQVQREELAQRATQSAAQIASNEKLTNAQLGVQERLGKLSAETSRSNAQLAADVNREEFGVRKDLTKAQIDASENLQKLQAEAAQNLNTKPVQYTTKDGKSLIRLERPDGSVMPQPKDKDGNELTYVPTDTDTNETKNLKALMALGVPQDDAINKIYNAKNANRDLAQAGIFKSITEGMSTMKNLGPKDFDYAKTKAKEITDSIYGEEGGAAAAAPAAPAATAPAATAPATPAPATPAPATPAPEKKTELTPAEKQTMIAAAKNAVKTGKSKAAVRQTLVDNNIDPAQAGL